MDLLTADLFLEMLENAANHLSNNHAHINALNVFPVPDGDTGTNMNLTFTNGFIDAKNSMSSHLGEVSKALSRGLLMGARGNSGVILSQIFRGFSDSLKDNDKANVEEVALAFVRGKESAYKAVMRPVEGTILTVLRESSDAAYEAFLLNREMGLLEYFEILLKEAHKSLDNTPNLLPVLKEVGVVDSGGMGYVTILEGFVKLLKGELIIQLDESEIEKHAGEQIEHDEFGYCTEFILRLDEDRSHYYDENKIRKELESIGNSLVVVTDDDLVKVHVHTLNPGNALNIGQQYGEFLKLKIENMSEQHDNLSEHHVLVREELEQEDEDYAIVTVAAGDGVISMFRDLRAKYVIEGGQTMNPSTEDFVAKIEKIKAENIIILPNNSNILMAAKQASEIIEDKNIYVLETKSIPQGLSACVMFNPEADIDENLSNMNDAIEHVKTGQITYAIKDTNYESVEIHKDDFIAIFDKDIVASEKEIFDACKILCEKMIDDDNELMTILWGENVEESFKNKFTDYVEANYDLEIEAVDGEQPVYSLIVGVE